MTSNGILQKLSAAASLLAATGFLLALVDSRLTRDNARVPSAALVVLGSETTSRKNAQLVADAIMLDIGQGSVTYRLDIPEDQRQFTDGSILSLIVVGDQPLLYALDARVDVSVGVDRVARFAARGVDGGTLGPFTTIGPRPENIELVTGTQPAFSFPLERSDCEPSICNVRIASNGARWKIERLAIARSIYATNAAELGS